MSNIKVQVMGRVAPACHVEFLSLRKEVHALSGEILLPPPVSDGFIFEILRTKPKEGNTPEEERKRKEEILRKIGGWIRAAIAKDGLKIRLDGEVQTLAELDLLSSIPLAAPEDFQVQYIPIAGIAPLDLGGGSSSISAGL